MKSKKIRTNVQLVTHMMDYSRYGALSQAFIFEAIRRYAEQVAAVDKDKINPNDWLFISFDGWQGVANEILKTLTENWGVRASEVISQGDKK